MGGLWPGDHICRFARQHLAGEYTFSLLPGTAFVLSAEAGGILPLNSSPTHITDRCCFFHRRDPFSLVGARGLQACRQLGLAGCWGATQCGSAFVLSAEAGGIRSLNSSSTSLTGACFSCGGVCLDAAALSELKAPDPSPTPRCFHLVNDC